MNPNVSINFKEMIDKIAQDDKIQAETLLNNLAITVAKNYSSNDILDTFLNCYESLSDQMIISSFWNLVNSTLNTCKDNSIILGILDLYLQLETHLVISEPYKNNFRQSAFSIFCRTENFSVQYQLFGYLMNFENYKEPIYKIIFSNKDKYSNLITVAERIKITDEFYSFFNTTYIDWKTSKDIKKIQFFIYFLNKYTDYIPYVAPRIRKEYRNTKYKNDMNEFFYSVLNLSEKYNSKEGIELVLTIYQADDIVQDMVKQYKDFAQYCEDAATSTDEDYLNDLSTEICILTNYIEAAGANTYEILPSNTASKTDYIDLKKSFKYRNSNKRPSLLAARKDILISYQDLLKINEIYRKVKSSNIRYKEILKFGYDYNAYELRSFLKLDYYNNDIISAIQHFGIHFYSEKFNSPEFTGCLIKFPKINKAAIIVNSELHGGKLNFTIAHELAHLSKGKNIESHFSSDKIYISFLYNEVEKECDKFASELLLPLEYIKSLIKNEDLSFNIIKDIAIKFKTSIEATSRRCIDLTFERYVLAVYEDYKLQYFYCNPDYYNDIYDSDISERLDSQTYAYKITEYIDRHNNGFTGHKRNEDISLWFNNYKNEYSIKSQVYVQHLSSKRILVLLQIPNHEYY